MMKSYPATSITRLSGEILACAARSPVVITRYRKPGYVVMSAEEYASITAPRDDLASSNNRGNSAMTSAHIADEKAQRATLEAFASRKIGREEVEERTGLYLSEVLVRMAELEIRRKPVARYEGMSEAQRKLFDEVFSA